MKLRPYQQEAHDAVLEKFDEHPSTLIVMPTGCGKTIVFAHLINSMSHARAMVMAHREELLSQAVDKIKACAELAVDVEKAEDYSYTGKMFKQSDVVVTSVQTQISGMKGAGRMTRFQPDQFGLFVIDEAHHAAADSYRRVLKHYQENPRLKVLGVTATPDRHDEEALGQIFKSVAHVYEINDAINDGWLVPISQQYVAINSMDFRAVRTTAGDLNGKDLAAVMEYEACLHEIAGPTIELVDGRQTLLFASSVAHAERLAEIFNRHRPNCARWVCGKTADTERQDIIGGFRKKEFQILCNVGIATEGFDVPEIECIVMARPTKSRALYCLDHETEILTDKGWITIKSDWNEESHRAATFNLATEEVRWSPITGSVVRQRELGEEMCGITSPRFDIHVTDGHQMLHQTRHGRRGVFGDWAFITADDLHRVPDCFRVPVAGMQKAPGVPLTDAELQFIGWVMTDGTINPANNQITISQGEHQPRLHEIDTCLKGCGFKYTRAVFTRQTQYRASSDCVRYTISKGPPRGRDKDLRGWGELAPYLDKDLSPQLEDVTQAQFEVLLEALHLGDGKKSSGAGWVRRSYHISTANPIFADRLQSLAIRRGHAANLAVHDYNKRPLYELHIKKQTRRVIGGANSKERPRFVRYMSTISLGSIVEPKNAAPKNLVWCIETTVGTIITRRKGKVCIMGNCQMSGRATRPLPGLVDSHETAEDRKAAIAASPKPQMEIIDFVGNSGNHKLMTSADILGGNFSDDVVERAIRNAKKSAKPTNPIDELSRAQQQITREHEAAQRRQVRGRADYRSQKIDPFGVLDLTPWRERGWDKSKPPSQKMIDLLARWKIPTDDLTFAQARQLIGSCIDRSKKNLCTFRQAALLKRYDYETDQLDFKLASRLINRIAANNWKRPPEDGVARKVS